MYEIILSFITAFSLTYFAIPSIIHVAKVKHLCDDPNERTSHSGSVPTLGGIAIFAAVLFSIVLWTPFEIFGDLQYIICAFIIIFLIGAKDDIDPIAPSKKLVGQLLAASILVFKSHVQLTSLFGVFGVYEIPPYLSIPLSIFTILVIINAFNLIDGINGLSGGIGALISIVLGTWFFLVDRMELAIVALSLAGAILAFLKYNFTPAKIFMGDTGALLLGVVCSILALEFIEFHQVFPNHKYAFKSVPAVAIGILILPLFDTARVFAMRVMRGKSPFYADRTHIHHLMIDLGLTHMQASSALVVVNALFILLAFKLHYIGTLNLLVLILSIATLLTFILYFSVRRKKLAQ